MSDSPRVLGAREAAGVYDNHGPGRAVAHFLGDLLPRYPLARVVSGYFYLSALGCIEDSLVRWLALDSPNASMRLLIGRETDRPTKEAILAALAGEYDRAAAIPHGELLAELIERGRLEVAVYTLAKLHGKVYLLLSAPLDASTADHLVEGHALWGSSNFTAPGIQPEGAGNLEFNAFSRDAHVLRSVHEWFEIRWQEARQGADITPEVFQVVQAALERFRGEAPIGPTPFEAYVRALQEVNDQLVRQAPADDVMHGLANFQRSAVSQALQILDRPENEKHSTGFFVCDGTGLGKTHVALAVLKHFLNKKWRALLIAPAAALRLTWQPHLVREDLAGRIACASLQSFDRAEQALQMLARSPEYDLVVIDESHHLRNRTSTRYQQIQELCRGPSNAGRRKRVLLLSATPINNRIDDLANQIFLFSGYGADLEGVLSSAIQKCGKDYRDIREILLDPDRRRDFVPELLGRIMVRRERWAVLEYYVRGAPEQAALAGGRPLSFLEQPPPRPLHYTLKGFDPDFYAKIEAAFCKLHLADIRVTEYLPEDALSDEVVRRAQGNEILVIQGLLKRLESSVRAFHVSLGRQLAFYEAFQQDLQAGKHLQRQALLSRRTWREDEDEEVEAAPFDVKNYDAAKAIEETEQDLATLRSLLELIERLDKPALDPKLASLRQQLEGFAGNRKVLIFSEYVDTAAYLFEQLYPRGKTALVTGQVARHGNRPRSETTTEAVVRAFAPRANPVPQGERFDGIDPVDVLISTDVLAEGQNFQDCNIVVNYDLTWNPVRVIQRVGRINRADSGAFHPPEDRKAHVLAFFPEEELTNILDQCLTIVETSRRKLRHIADIVGHAAAVLFEDEHTNQILFDRLAHAQDISVYREIEQRQASGFGLGAAFDDDELLAQEYRRLAQQHPELAARVRALPLPVISCRSSAAGEPGVAALVRERVGDSSKLRWLWSPAQSAAPAISEKQKGLVVKNLRCLPRSLRRPLTVPIDQVRRQLDEWLAAEARHGQEVQQMARPSAAIAGKSIFTNLSERLETEVTKLPLQALAEPAFQEQLTRVNEWIAAADQLVFAQRDAATAEVDQLLQRRVSGRDLFTAAVELGRRYPVVSAAPVTAARAAWELVVAEEIREEKAARLEEAVPSEAPAS